MLYRQHCLSNLLIVAGLEACAIHYQFASWELRLEFAGAFVLATFLLSPDLDLHHSAPSQNWGLLKTLWWPYSKLFRHRGWSHVPIVGSLTRLSYLGAFVFFLSVSKDALAGSFSNLAVTEILNTRFQEFNSLLQAHPAATGTLLAGVVAADLAHLLGDMLWSGLRFCGFLSRRKA